MQISKQPVLNIGIVGHIDHGKTTLLYHLTGVWADKHSEELKRGITIKLGYADSAIKKCEKCNKYTTKNKCECGGNLKEESYVSFVDAPGHEMLMATMLGGSSILDAAILVIAANEKFPQPQTKEHLLALESRGINQIIIVQNKLDLISKEDALKQYEEIKKFLKNTIAKDALIIPICSQQEINIDNLLEAIAKFKIPERDLNSKPLFLIVRSFDVNKPGTTPEKLVGGILGGSLKCGKLKAGDEIEIKPGKAVKRQNRLEYKTIKTKIIDIRAGSNKISDDACPGGSLALQTALDPILTKTDGLSGCLAGLSGTLPEIAYKIKIKANLFKEIVGSRKELKIEPIKTNENLMLSVNTTITLGNVTKSKNNEVELELKIPIVPFSKDRVGIARNYEGRWRLIGHGEIVL